MFKKLFLPVGLLLAIPAALYLTEGGLWLREIGAIPVMAGLIFLINGAAVPLEELRPERGSLKALLAGAAICLLLAPFLGQLSGELLGLEAAALLGLIVMSAAPPTLSSGIVITGLAGGSTGLALVITISFNLLGILSIPLLLPVLLEGSGSVEVDSLALLTKLVYIILLPFLAGALLRKRMKLGKLPALFNYLPSLFVILTVYASLAASAELLRAIEPATLGLFALASLCVHGALLLLQAAAGRVLGLGLKARTALLFTGSQKTLPVALSVLIGLGTDAGLAVLVCLVFHFLQLIVDSALAGWMARQHDPRAA